MSGTMKNFLIMAEDYCKNILHAQQMHKRAEAKAKRNA